MIDILMAVYNGEKYLESQITSILTQTESEFRLIIRDDGSTDKSLEVIRAVCEKQGRNYHMLSEEMLRQGELSMPAGEREIIILYGGEPSGSAKNNFLRLLSYSTGDYIMFSDQDDIWEANKVLISMKAMKKLEQKYGTKMPLLLHTDLVVMDESEQVISDSMIAYANLPRKDLLRELLVMNSVTGCTMMANPEAGRLLKMVKEDWNILMHDHFFAVLIAAFGRVSCYPEATVRYRQHGDNEVGTDNAKSLSYRMGKYRKGKFRFREDMEASYQQAGYILSAFSDELGRIPPERIQMLEEYAALSEKSSKERRKVYRKYGIYKQGKMKKFFQNLWC